MGNEYLLPLAAAVGFVFFSAFLAFVWLRGQALVHYFEEQEFNTEAFFVWVIRKRAFDKRATWILIPAFAAWYGTQRFLPDLINPLVLNPVFYGIIFIALVVGALSSYETTRAAGKYKDISPRAKRIHTGYMALMGAYFATIFANQTGTEILFLTLAFLAFFQAPPLFIVAANFIMRPWETIREKRNLTQAKLKLSKLSPVIIGITGSHGKTMAKHLLTHILSANKPTLTTPDNVEGTQGICDTILQDLKNHHRYFVIEMEAHGLGSIKKLCQLAPPNLGIITSVGLGQSKRLRTLERVFRANFELADDLMSRRERTILNADAIPEDLLNTFTNKNPNVLFCGGEKSSFDLDIVLKKGVQGNNGLDLTLGLNQKGRQETLELQVPLYGPHNCYNIMLAVAAALELGQSTEVIQNALKTVPQIPHRLEAIQGVKGPTVIDDSYNTFPEGFQSALKVLSDLRKPKGRCILVTPGLVDMGTAHDAEHKKLGEMAGKHVDVALIIGPKRMSTFMSAFNSTKEKGAQLRTFDTQSDANDWIKQNADNNDIILFEASLPNLYDTQVKF